MTMNFFVHVRIIFKCLRFFLKVIGRKLTKIKTILPLPPKPPVLGKGYDGYPRDFSGNVVGGMRCLRLFPKVYSKTYTGLSSRRRWPKNQ